MGWKNIKEAYQIKHLVCVTPKGICIGSSYIHNIIVIGLDGVIRTRYDDRSNKDLRRYQQEMDADPGKLKRLILAPDSFETSITVYTYDGGNIIEKQCEVLEWPNVTHDGEMMYENTFSTDKTTVVQWAKRTTDANIERLQRNISETKAQLVAQEASLVLAESDRVKLYRLLADGTKNKDKI